MRPEEVGSDSGVRGRRRTAALVAVGYVVLTAVFWGTHVLDRGLSREMTLVELSQDRPWWQGFLYPHDSSRRLLSLPFHVAYLLSDGSYLSLHLLFGVFVFLTGWLTYVLIRRLAPDAPFVAFLAGAMALTHGADGSVNWVPMIIVREAVVAILFAAWLLRVGWEEGNRWWIVPALGAAQAVALWTYEASLPVVLLGPLLIWRPGAGWRRFAAWSAAWWAVPGLNLATLVYRYVVAHDRSYQSARIASDFDAGTAAKVLGRLVHDGLVFWAWPNRSWWATVLEQCGDAPLRIGVPLLVGVVAFVVIAVTLRRRLPPDAVPWAALAVGAALFLLVAYTPFLLLGAAGSWRTHFYAAPPAGVLLALMAIWVDARFRARRWLATALATLAVGTGLAIGLAAQFQMTREWALHRDVVWGIVAAAPRVKDGTLVVLVGVPARSAGRICDPVPRADPFVDTMWFNSAVQVLYPRTRLVALYWREDGSSPGSIRFRFDAQGASVEQTTIELEGTRFGYDQMIAFRYVPGRGSTLLPQFPAGDVPGAVASGDYRPEARILPGPPPNETVRKLAR